MGWFSKKPTQADDEAASERSERVEDVLKRATVLSDELRRTLGELNEMLQTENGVTKSVRRPTR